MAIHERFNEKHHQLTRAEAEKLLKSAKVGARFNVYIRIDLKINNDPEHVYRDGGTSHLKLSKQEAIRLVRDLVSDKMENEKGARIPVLTYDYEMYKRGSSLEKQVVTYYWIG